MGPLSITAGVLALLGACITTGAALKEFYDGVAMANLKIKGLLTDVDSFTQVLRLMKDTLEQENIQSSLQSTGHIGNHWNNLSTSTRDGQSTLVHLQETIEKANKSVSLLDGPRRHLRLKGAADEIAVYQQQIRSYRDTLQLSLQTVILWNQFTVRESTDKIMPNLDEIQLAIRRIALDINERIAGLQNVIESNSSEYQLRSLNNLKNCVKSAASVVSSASTTLGVERSGRFSVAYGSEFGDIFPSEPSETVLRWISSNTVHEFEEEKDTESSLSGAKPASGKSPLLVEGDKESDPSDSDGELEAEIIQSLLRLGKDKLASQEFEAAERHFRNCLTRASSNISSASLHRHLGSTSEIMTLLLLTYRHQKKWDEAHSLLLEKIAVESRGSSKANQSVLADMLVLVEVLLKKSAHTEALLYGRRALKSYRKLGSEGTLGVQDSLRLLCQVCKAAGNHDEEDAYSAILSDILLQPMPAMKPTAIELTEHDPEPIASPKMSTIKSEGSAKGTTSQTLGTPDTLDWSSSNWPSSDELTPKSAARAHQRGSSLSSFGSAGPASPNTVYTSSSIASRESSYAVKETLVTPIDIYVSSMSPLTGLEDTIEQLKVESDLQAVPASVSTAPTLLTSESSKTNDTSHPQEVVPTDSLFPATSKSSNPLRRQKSQIPTSMANHFQRNYEEAAIKYFREGKGNPPKPVIPTSRVPIPFSDYELPQWLGTLQMDLNPVELPTISLDPPEKLIQKSKSAIDLFDLGVVELPAESLLHQSKSTTNLRRWDTNRAGFDGFDPANHTFAVKDEIDWDAVSAPLDRFAPAGASKANNTEFKKPPKSDISSSTAWSQPENGTALIDVGKYDDSLLKALIGMGCPRMKALAALEKHDYNLERAADHLVNESSEESHPPGSQFKHTRSKSASSTSKAKRMGVQDFSFFVTQVSETTADSSIPTINIPSPSSVEPSAQPVSFQTLVQLQSARSSGGFMLNQPGFTALTTRRSEPNLTEQARSHKKSLSLQDELSNANYRIKEPRPRNPIATHFDVNSNLPVEWLTKRSFVAKDPINHTDASFTSKNQEASFSNQPDIRTPYEASTNNLSTAPAVTFSEILTDRDAIRRKLVITGDPFCGKSCLCSVFAKKVFPEIYRSTELETSIAHMEVGGKRVELILWDTGGDYNIFGIRLHCYPDSHVVMICFAINHPDSLENAEEMFMKEFQKADNCSARYILVGLKADLRYDWETIKRLRDKDQSPVTGDEGRAAALRIGAAKYLECSAKTGEDVMEVFEAASRLALMPSEKLKKMQSFRRLFGKE